MGFLRYWRSVIVFFCFIVLGMISAEVEKNHPNIQGKFIAPCIIGMFFSAIWMVLERGDE